jgi:antirestriction protein ArdC
MKPVIEITTARKREHAIKVDGKQYELRHPGELSYLDGKSFRMKAARLTEIEKASTLTTAEREEHERIAAEVCTAIVDAPAGVIAKLSSAQQVAVINTYFALLIQSAQAALKAASKPRKR